MICLPTKISRKTKTIFVTTVRRPRKKSPPERAQAPLHRRRKTDAGVAVVGVGSAATAAADLAAGVGRRSTVGLPIMARRGEPGGVCYFFSLIHNVYLTYRYNSFTKRQKMRVKQSKYLQSRWAYLRYLSKKLSSFIIYEKSLDVWTVEPFVLYNLNDILSIYLLINR